MAEPVEDELRDGMRMNGLRVCSLLALRPSVLLLVALGFVCSVLLNIIGIVENNTVGSIVDIMANAKSEGERFHVQLTTLAFVYVAQAIFAFATSFVFQWAGFILGIATRAKLFSAVMYQDTAFFDNATTGELTSRLTTDCQVVEVCPMSFALEPQCLHAFCCWRVRTMWRSSFPTLFRSLQLSY